MSDGFLVTQYDGSQRETYTLCAFTSEAKALAWFAFLEAQCPGIVAKEDLEITPVTLDGDEWEAGGAWEAQVGPDGQHWQTRFTPLGHPDDAETGAYPMPSYFGYGKTIEEAKEKAVARAAQMRVAGAPPPEGGPATP